MRADGRAQRCFFTTDGAVVYGDSIARTGRSTNSVGFAVLARPRVAFAGVALRLGRE